MKSYHRSLYTYPWDVADRGARSFASHALDLGMNGVTLAASYHAGKFLRPHAAQGPRVIFPEDGVVYFEPNVSRYGELRAVAHGDRALRTVFAQLADDGRLRLHAWTVLLHNSRLGALHPQYTVKNAFGDGYVYSLCPMQPAVYEYALALASDAAAQGVRSLVLETPGWLPYSHGYHHEFAQLRRNAWLDAMLGLCFCDACVAAGRAAGIDADALRERVAGRVGSYLAAPADASAQQAADWLAGERAAPDFAAFTRLRQQRVSQLVSAIRAALPAGTLLGVIPTVQRPTSQCWLEGSDLGELATRADWLEVPFYESDAARVVADARETLAAVDGRGKVCAILRPGPPDLGDGRELAPALDGLSRLGIRDVSFYNYGLLRSAQLDALGRAVTCFDRSVP